MKALVHSITKNISYVVAFCILVTAVLVVAGRLITPILNKNLPDIEKWASALLQTPVTIGKADVSWFKYQPGVRLKTVTILGKDGKDPLLQVGAVRVFFSIPQSLWQHKLVPSGIVISGTSIHLNQSASGDVSVQGFSQLPELSGQPYQHETKFADLMAILSTQSHLILNDIDIRYKGFNGQKRFVTLYNLSFRNGDSEHFIDGQAVLHQEIPTELSMAVKWQGKQYDPAQIKAKIYLYASGLSLKQWMKEFSYHGFEVKQGLASVKLWGTLEAGKFKKLQSLFQMYGLELYDQSNKSSHVINRLSGNVGVKHKDQNYIIAGEDILIDLPTRLWPVTQFYLSMTQTAEGKFIPKIFTLGYFSLEDSQTFLSPSATWLPADIHKQLLALQLKGSLENLTVNFQQDWNDWHKLSLSTRFHQIEFQPSKDYPGVQSLSGQIKWDGQQADVQFNSQRTVLQYDELFAEPIAINQLLGKAQLKIDPSNAWVLQLTDIQMVNDEMKLQVTGQVTSQTNASPFADLSANFSLQNTSHLSRYLPVRWFDQTFVDWMKAAFVSGEWADTQMMVKGPINDFPFDHQNGTFTLTGKVNNLHLHYAPLWPDMQHIYGKIAFVNRKMTLDIDKAELLNIPLEEVHGEMLDVGGQSTQVLQIRSDKIQTDFSKALVFINQSPLQATMGKMISNMKLSGPVLLKLGLTVPVANAENTNVLGDIHFDDAQLKLPAWDLAFNHLKGDLHFTEAIAEANLIKAELFKQPVVLSLHSVKNKQGKDIVRASLTNQLQIADLEKWLKIPFSKVVNGRAAVNTDIDLSFTEPMEIHLQSNLIGIGVKLPDQYAKKVQESRDFTADILIAEHQPLRMKLNYGKLINAALVLTENKNKFDLFSADIHLGNGLAEWPKEHGLYITGHFAQLDWDKIKKYIDQYGNNTELPSIALREIDVVTDKLELVGQRINDVNLRITPHKTDWHIDINSQDINGTVLASKKLSKRGHIDARFQAFNLNTQLESGNSRPLSFNTAGWPEISFEAEKMSYNDMYLGQVAFDTTTTKHGLEIESLHVSSPRIRVDAEGDWLHSGKKNQSTHLEGDMSSERVSELINSLGYNASSFISHKGRMKFDFAWDGTPFSPSVATLNGYASISLGQGRIIDLGESNEAKMDIGRMLSILSVHTIMRRLQLDFRDLFQKGYSFDSVKGDFTFRDGNAFTNNLRINGPVASIAISGRIGFKEKDYDFTLSVTPYITSSIPVAATLLSAWNPIVGIATLAANTVISPAVSQAATRYYEVKGPWASPVWREIRSRG